MVTKNERHDYLANCFYHLLTAPCDPKHNHRRERDLAEVVRIAARAGEDAAHAHLLELVSMAERGRYRDERPRA
jgi:hypothetical protein